MLDELIEERRKKLTKLNEAGVGAYPARTERTHTVLQALDVFLKDATGGNMQVAIAGRVMSFRDQGGVMFLDVRDGTGMLQAVLKKEELPNFDLMKEALDRGDFISVRGGLFVTNRGQKSVAAKEVVMLTKSLRPLPSEHFGLENEEERLRQRYVDLILNPETREMFRKKSEFWGAVREFLKKQGFMEVETSVLEPQAGGAEAEPFKTHHNALDTDFYLRISLELQLKRLIVGGYDKVFEIGRVFRNEGIDRDHLQDFTFMEFYWAYRDYNDLMKLLEKMYKFVIKKTTGGLTTTWQGQSIDWGAKWPKVDYVKLFVEANGMDPVRATREKLFDKAVELDLAPEASLGKGRLIDLIYKKTVRPKLIQPCFLVNTPLEVSPLAKANPKRPGIAERVQPVACGAEIGNGFSELNDPIDQRARFETQMQLREAGDAEAMPLDEDFLRALEYGMPPTAGFGMSERVFAILMDKPVREAVFFPLMRPGENK